MQYPLLYFAATTTKMVLALANFAAGSEAIRSSSFMDRATSLSIISPMEVSRRVPSDCLAGTRRKRWIEGPFPDGRGIPKPLKSRRLSQPI